MTSFPVIQLSKDRPFIDLLVALAPGVCAPMETAMRKEFGHLLDRAWFRRLMLFSRTA